jgi:hypothetical protein
MKTPASAKSSAKEQQRYWMLVDWCQYSSSDEDGKTYATIDTVQWKIRDNINECLSDLVQLHLQQKSTSAYYLLIQVVPVTTSIFAAVRTGDLTKIKMRIHRHVGLSYPREGRGQLDKDVLKALAELIDKESVHSVEIPPAFGSTDSSKEIDLLTCEDLDYLKRALNLYAASHGNMIKSTGVLLKIQRLAKKINNLPENITPESAIQNTDVSALNKRASSAYDADVTVYNTDMDPGDCANR